MRRYSIAASILILLCIGIGIGVWVQREEEIPVVEETPVAREAIHQRIGTSVEGRAIDAYTYPSPTPESATHLLFVGGVHGGYEWNSVLLAHTFMDHFENTPEAIPDDLTITIIPSANPDGLYKVLGTSGRFSAADARLAKDTAAGRFNANGVDLNRNFDCKWQPESTWRGNVVSAGDAAFSEPEARAIRDFVLEHEPSVVTFWHSQANAVYASECEDGILSGTLAAMDAYARAAGYNAVDSFDAYPISGDAEGWLASINIPAITVELSNHDTIEWNKNHAGVAALFDLYSRAAR